MTSTALPQALTRYRGRIDAELDLATRGSGLELYTMVRYHLGFEDAAGAPVRGDRGKAIRPTLCLLMCEALGGSVQAALPAAAGLELLHNFTLIHDDVMDGDATRRHRPTVWSIWGTAQAIDAGDLLHALAMRCVLRGADAARARDAAQVVADGCALVTEGQHLDLDFESRSQVTVADYLGMIERKSATLIAVALELGAVFAGNDPAIRAACRAYGRQLGAAFQIRDDMLGVWGETEVTGKPVGADLARRKKTLPVLHAAAHAPDPDRARLAAMMDDPNAPPDVEAAAAILNRAGAREFTARRLHERRARAAQSLASIPVTPWGRAHLTALADYIVGRDK